jgi:WhiB family redox-sensing transcriptional regulator
LKVYLAEIPPEGGGLTHASIEQLLDLGSVLAVAEVPEYELPCRTDEADLWFAERPEQVGRAQALCQECPIRNQCLAGALIRREPWGVWGGEIFDHGRIVPFKRGRGRPAKSVERTVA